MQHRRTYYDLKYVDYDSLMPGRIAFLPPEGVRELWREDYAEMLRHFIFGKALDFDALMERMKELEGRFRAVGKIQL